MKRHWVIATRGRRRGFTLMEAALTTIIVGVGVTGMLQLLAAGTSANIDASEQTTAMNLAKNVREWTLQKTYDQVRAMDGQEYTPPRDSSGSVIGNLTGWKQSLTMTAVDPDRLTRTLIDTSPDVIRITTIVSHDGKSVAQLVWYRFKP
ncbi:MAG: type IV pilus modification PilV family protein [Tepidisphaeraceae bacterium]